MSQSVWLAVVHWGEDGLISALCRMHKRATF